MGSRRVRGVIAWAGVLLLGLLFASPAGPPVSQPVSTLNSAAEPGAPWASSISWNGQLAAQVCAPSGIASCTGIRQGEHDDLHIMSSERSPSSVELELRWDATSESSEELVMWLDGVTTRESCDGCVSYRFRVLEKVQGTSPLRLNVSDLSLAPGENLAILVRLPDELPRPVMAQARAAQPFDVDGFMRGE